MSNEGVVNATSFKHFHGEGDSDYIEWTFSTMARRLHRI